MITIETSTVIYRPIEEVFAYLTDARSDPQWDTAVHDQRADAALAPRTSTLLHGRDLDHHKKL